MYLPSHKDVEGWARDDALAYFEEEQLEYWLYHVSLKGNPPEGACTIPEAKESLFNDWFQKEVELFGPPEDEVDGDKLDEAKAKLWRVYRHEFEAAMTRAVRVCQKHCDALEKLAGGDDDEPYVELYDSVNAEAISAIKKES